MRDRAVLLGVLALAALGGCKKDKWIQGQWLLVTPEGKPGQCYQFEVGKERLLKVFTDTSCKGEPDQLLSGKWQLKSDNKLAVQQGSSEEAHLVLITEKDAEHIVASGAIAGTLYRLPEEGGGALLRKLTDKGAIKLRPLPLKMGCAQLGLPLKQIKALPTEPKPRMIRQKDQGLEYHVDKATGDPKVEKIVYALNQEVIDWVAFHLAPAAFEAPGPRGRVEGAIGAPGGEAGTGVGPKRQHISMWRTYCTELRGAKNKDIDLTLFATAGQRRGTIYVSENIVSGIWEELQQAVRDAPPPEEDEGSAEAAPPGGKPAAAAVPAAPPAPAPAAKTPAPAPKPAPKPAPRPAPVAKPAPAPKSAAQHEDDDPI